MLGILLVTESPICVHHRDSDHIVSGTDDWLEMIGDIKVSDEQWLHRIISHNVTGSRWRCVISGVVNRSAPYRWHGFEEAHIFPLGKEDYWNQWGYSRWITDMDDNVGMSKINSTQNGVLLRSDVHQLFDQYLLSVNPDDNYKVIVFDLDGLGIDARVLLGNTLKFGNDERQPVDQLLRWHFRQAVLASMRGAGEPVFEVDFPPGLDMMGEIMSGPMAAERMEFELCSRLESQ
ncbi:HNH endonuclease-domain-containing protein [Tirmania nivea]|nr:HNH endonuclease-domain-containing protein [Tirmania nivea]